MIKKCAWKDTAATPLPTCIHKTFDNGKTTICGHVPFRKQWKRIVIDTIQNEEVVCSRAPGGSHKRCIKFKNPEHDCAHATPHSPFGDCDKGKDPVCLGSCNKVHTPKSFRYCEKCWRKGDDTNIPWVKEERDKKCS
jgi:hypothetical protein